MKAAGIIAEYNPFHNGHRHLLDAAKHESGAVIAVMSGHFIQRGDIAITDKWTRAASAVSCGCDLVLELPVCFALSSAADFARGAITLLDKLKIVDTLYFGAECGDTDRIARAARALLNEPPAVSEDIKKYASLGLSYPAAYEKAWNGVIGADLLSMPNNLLAVEYVKSLISINSSIKPRAVRRVGAEHDGAPVGDTASASYIRGLIKSGGNYSAYVPDAAYEIYKAADMTYDLARLDAYITGVLRGLGAEYLASYAPEGLENRIKAAANENYGFEAICAAVKSKRYTMSRVKRIILSAVLGLPAKKAPSYARALAMNETGAALLREIKRRSDIDIIVKTAAYDKADEMFLADLRATDIFAMCSADDGSRRGGRDYTVSPAVIRRR